MPNHESHSRSRSETRSISRNRLEESDDEGDEDPDHSALLRRERRSSDCSTGSNNFFSGTGRGFPVSTSKSWLTSRLPPSTQAQWSDFRERFGPKSGRATTGNTIRIILFSSWANVLLVFVPFAVLSELLHVAPIVIFGLNALAIVPLTTLLTYATENVAHTLGVGMGALLNITFGNLVELIILYFMLKENHLRLVLASLLGSLFVNLLFILGIAVVAGGLRNQEQLYSIRVTHFLVYFMDVGILAILMPTSLHAAVRHKHEADMVTLEFSRGTSVLLLLVYLLYLHFMLRSRDNIMEDSDSRSVSDDGDSPQTRAGSSISRSLTPNGSKGNHQSIEMHQIRNSRQKSHARSKSEPQSSYVAAAHIPLQPEDIHAEPIISRKASVVLLLASAAVVSICAEALVDSIEHVVANARLTEAFLGLILLPLLGNTAELATAVTVALKDKMDLAINVTVGSGIQISTFMAPFMVTLAWSMGKPLSLNFDNFQIITLLAATMMVNGMMMGGRSHYLLGALLICVYVMIAIGAFVMPNQNKAEIG